MKIALIYLCLTVLLPLSLVVAYQWILAIVSIRPSHPGKPILKGKRVRFLILIPAHNEESVLPQTLESLRGLDYPKDLMKKLKRKIKW